jgi:hypothetical protein
MRSRPALRRLHEDPNTQPSRDPAGQRSEAVRKLNTQVRNVIEWLPHGEGTSLDFFCECGCCEPVELTIAEYDALDGEPVYRAGHPAT